MADVSARPALLRDFVTQAGQIRTQLSSRMTALRTAYDSCAASSSPFVPRQPGLMGQALPAFISSYQADETFVDVVREAFDNADVNGDGIAEMTEAEFDAAFAQAAYNRGLDPNILMSQRQPITVDDPVMAAVPQTSGFVADPVCTATGHLVEVEDDLAWPARLEVLRWRRVYSSRFVAAGPFGRGWGTWASALCLRQDDGGVVFQGPDGQLAVFRPDREGGWQRLPGVLAKLSAAGADEAPGGLVLTWDAHSVRSSQRWVFGADGLVRSVWGPTLGTTTFEYADERLAALVHDGGRQLTVEWRGDRIAAVRSSCGRSVSYEYNEAGDLIGVQRAVGDHRYVPDTQGLIVEVWDADDVRLCHNTYDADGRVLRQVSPFGRETVFSYKPGFVAVVSDTTDGPVSTWEHDSTGRLVALTNDAGQRLSRTFDGEGRVVAMTGFDGTTLTNRFDDAGNLVGARFSDGYTQTWGHDDRGRVTSYAAPGGQQLVTEYDDDSVFPARLSGPGGWEMRVDIDDGLVRSVTDADGVRVDLEHDGDGNLVASRDAVGRETRLVNHPSGAPVEVYLPDGAVFRCDRDDAGRLLALHAPTGDTWRVEFTPAGRRRGIVEPNGARISVEHGSHGAEERLIDALGNATELRHDHLQRLVGVTCTDGAKWEFSHTAMGQVSMLEDPTGALWLYDYDAEGRLVSATDPVGARRQRRYDPAGGLVELIDPEGARTRFARDEAGRLVGRIEDDDAATSFEYDEWDRVIAATSPDGGRIEYGYSPAGRLISVRSSAGRGSDLGYDAAGRLVARTDTLGAATRYEWDAVDRLVGVISPSGRAQRCGYDHVGRRVWADVGGLRSHFEHDHAGRLTRITDPLGSSQQFAYDHRGRLVSATDAFGNTVRQEWDERGNLVASVDPFGSRTRFRHDAMRRSLGVTDQLGRTTMLERDAAGRVTRRLLANGDEVEFRLNRRGQTTDLAVNGREVLVWERDRRGRPVIVHEPGRNRTHTLTWSAGSRLLRLASEASVLAWEFDTDGLATSRTVSGVKTAFTYDAAGRLSSIQHVEAPAVVIERDVDGRVIRLGSQHGFERRFGHDLAGHLVGYSQTVSGNTAMIELVRDANARIVEERRAEGTITYGYDAGGQLVRAAGPAGQWAWRYDAGGRLVAEDAPRGSRSFLYDDAHQLVREEGPQGVTTFRYDEVGRRVEERDDAGETRVRYEWDGLNRLARVERAGATTTLDVDGFGSLVAVNQTALVWDPTAGVPELLSVGDRQFVGLPGRPLAAIEGSDFGWLGADWRGSIGEYDPWGAPLGGEGSDGDGVGGDGFALGYSGELAVDGLVWLRARAYDPASRQFLSPDPLPGVAGSAFAANPYHYAGNDPIGHADPLGLAPVSIEQYQSLREQATGPQWANIAMVALTVGSFFIPGGPLVMMAVGAAMGAAPGIIQGVTTGNWDPMNIMQGALIGGVAGRFGAGAGSGWRAVGTGALIGGGTSTATELWDAYLPGGDGSFDGENVLLGIGIGGLAGGGGYALANRRPRITDTGPSPEIDLPVHVVDGSRTPQIAHGTDAAFAAGHPNVLHRTTDPDIISANRDAATAGFTGRPLSPDEYPFASTIEGGPGAHVTPVPLREQRVQGGQISSFYQKHGIGDGDPFRVEVRWPTGGPE